MATIQENLTHLVNVRKNIIKALNDINIKCDYSEKLEAIPPYILKASTGDGFENKITEIANGTNILNYKFIAVETRSNNGYYISWAPSCLIFETKKLSCLINHDWGEENAFNLTFDQSTHKFISHKYGVWVHKIYGIN